MGKYFGTDGIRGVAGTELTPDLAFKTGQALAAILGKKTANPLVLIGKDTRRSGDMLECALMAGLMAGGASVQSLGVLPTPAVAFMTRRQKAAAGIVISASHNPFYDNGIKIFGGDGFKLSDDDENQIETLIDNSPAPGSHENIGSMLPPNCDAAALYADYVKDCAKVSLSGMKLLIDCSNGAAFETARLIFPVLGADCTFLANRPNGLNINENCGSTHLNPLKEQMKKGGFHLGIAFDGDADRCLMVDESGAEVDGDKIMAAMALYMKKNGALKGSVVCTVMSNLGLHAFAKANGITVATTKVGDRYVLEEMQKGGHNLGGEQSGHIILLDHSTTGDGQLTAAVFLSALAQSRAPASRFIGQIEMFPQVLINVAVPSHLKAKAAEMQGVLAIKAQIETLFGADGRILIRPSGTEPKVRVMVEGRDPSLVEKMAKAAAKAIEDECAKL